MSYDMNTAVPETTKQLRRLAKDLSIAKPQGYMRSLDEAAQRAGYATYDAFVKNTDARGVLRAKS